MNPTTRMVFLFGIIFSSLLLLTFKYVQVESQVGQMQSILQLTQMARPGQARQVDIFQAHAANPVVQNQAAVIPPIETPRPPVATPKPAAPKPKVQKSLRPEPPLPIYGPFFDRNHEPLATSAYAVCSDYDKPLANSDPRPSAGCRGQRHSKGIHFECRQPLPVSCDMRRDVARDTFYSNLVRISAKCDGLSNIGDEEKDGVWRVCLSPPYDLKKNSCLVYSFGINDEWSFDDTISKVHRCDLRAFDPSMNQSEHKRDDRISFYNVGVKGHGMRFKDAKQQKWKMMTIKEIVEMIGHGNRIIDLLKVDIDYAEWDAYEDLVTSGLLKNVKQLVTEFHAWADHTFAYVRFYRILIALENAGFEKWFINNKVHMRYDAPEPETNRKKTYHYQIDVSYINTRFL